MIKYIISSILPYHLLICNDAGPEYAKMMGWRTIYTTELKHLNNSDIYVVDNRISASECILISEIVSSNRHITFVLKIVDPYIEHLHNFYYQWLISMSKLTNVQLLTVYEPKEFTEIIRNFSKNPIIYIPYAYDRNKEVALERVSKRKNQIIISGSLNSQYYPKRARIWQESRRSFSRIFYPILKHPGYSEMDGRPISHQLTGSSYVSYLAKHKFMLLCGSRCRIELLKFHECAYSGCLPIGETPTMLKDMDEIFKYPNTSRLTLDTIRLITDWNLQDHLKRLNYYRDYLQKNRNKEILNIAFLNQVAIS